VTIYSNKSLEFAHSTDAASDLVAVEDTVIPAWGRGLVRTGLIVALPNDKVGLVCSRSGLALKNGVMVLNSPGVIDSGYRGEVGVILANLSDKDFIVHEGDRIAQFMIIDNKKNDITVLSDEEVMGISGDERGVNGFGSSGV